MRLGLFDSGIGGLTVLKKVIELLSNHPFVQSNPETALKIANFRIKSLGKFR